MRYADYIEVNENFQSSVNLEYDLNRMDKVQAFIPTEQSVQILEQYLRSVYYNTEGRSRATVLIGPYGRGKSHLMLQLLALTSMDVLQTDPERVPVARAAMDEACDKIREANPEVGALAGQVVESQIRLLPVIVNCSGGDVRQALLRALDHALNLAGLESLLPDTYFDAALSVLDTWEQSLPEAKAAFAQVLADEKQTIEQLQIGLKRYDQACYEQFCRSYPKVAAGMSFHPLSDADAVQIYTAVAHALSEKTAYCGVHIVFDEFSKFLEASADSSRRLEFKVIQDLAEAAVRSGKEQIHFTCITHREITDYSASDSFKTIEGRFKKVYFVASSEHSYELISNAIHKGPKFPELMETHAAEFREIRHAIIPGVFQEMEQEIFEKKMAEGCFPIAPLSAYCLLQICELVGQNERSLFTFLTQEEPHSLVNFLKASREHLDLLTADVIYDYFSPLFQKEVFNARVHTAWAKADSALRQTTQPEERAILKVIALINMIGDDGLKATQDAIKAALWMSDEAFQQGISGLLRRHVLLHRDNAVYVMLTANGIDVQKKVEEYVSTKISRVSESSVLNDVCEWGPVLPREYNDTFCILRSFQEVFMERELFLTYQTAEELLATCSTDGMVIYLIETTEDAAETVEQKVASFAGAPQIIVARSDMLFTRTELIKRYVAAVQLMQLPDNKADAHIYEELALYAEDLRRQLQTIAQQMFAAESVHSRFSNCDGPAKVARRMDLCRLASSVCSKLFCSTPVINNEMVNKNVLNAQNGKGRDLAVKWLLESAGQKPIPVPPGYGPEVSIFRSVYVRTGLDGAEISSDDGLNRVLEEIRTFVRSCEGKQQRFQRLYNVLQRPPYGVRLGVIPLLIAYVVRDRVEDVVFYYKTKEIPASADTLRDINRRPDEYSLLVESGAEDRAVFLQGVKGVFQDKFKGPAGLAGSSLLHDVLNAMQQWARALPHYTQRYTKRYCNGSVENIPEDVLSLRRDLLKFEVNARDLLVGKWMHCGADVTDSVRRIGQIRETLDNHMPRLRQEMTTCTIQIFCSEGAETLNDALAAWYGKLPQQLLSRVNDRRNLKLIELGKKATALSSDQILDELIQTCVGVRMEDWNDTLCQGYLTALKEALSQIASIKAVPTGADTDWDGKITLQIGDTMIDRSVRTKNISPLGNTMLRNLLDTFEEYNESIPADERMAILAKLITYVSN